jgi:hypothetical protein
VRCWIARQEKRDEFDDKEEAKEKEKKENVTMTIQKLGSGL